MCIVFSITHFFFGKVVKLFKHKLEIVLKTLTYEAKDTATFTGNRKKFIAPTHWDERKKMKILNYFDYEKKKALQLY